MKMEIMSCLSHCIPLVYFLFYYLSSLSPILSALSSGPIYGDFMLPNVDRLVYDRPGDINIGSMMILTDKPDKHGCVSKHLYPGSWGIQYPEAVAFAVDVVNRNPDLLPNITLGFYVLDDCTNRGIALAQALTFIPRADMSCRAELCNATASTYSSTLSSGFTEDAVPFYDVVGLLAPMLSTSALSVSYMMSAVKMPIVGYTTTSDDFSDKSTHPMYLTVVTRDKYQALAMLEFISANNWTYISVVYSQGTYGERAFDTIHSSAPQFKICIATSHRVGDKDNTDPIADELIQNEKARVVILFADSSQVTRLFESIERKNKTGEFIWICCDSVYNAAKATLLRHKDSIVGAFMFNYYTGFVTEFYDYIRSQNVSTSQNPWFKPAWEMVADCSFEKGTCDPEQDITNTSSFAPMTTPNLAMDAVLLFAHGIHDMILDLCPNVNGSQVRDCVKRDLLINYLRNVSFEGYTGYIDFNSDFEYKGKYEIVQVAYDNIEILSADGTTKKTSEKGLVNKLVAIYDTANDTLTYTSTAIFWNHLNKRKPIVTVKPGQPEPEVPESVCSRPCKNGEYKDQKELVCCWECRTCRSNERIIENFTNCQACEEFTWPDPTKNFSICAPIPLTYHKPSETLPAIQIGLAIIAIIFTFLVIAAYIYYRENRIMKAASRELSVLQLFGIFSGYVTVVIFQTTPTATKCAALYFLFCLSFAWLYSPLLIKAIRIYRIFQSGSKNNRRPRFISPKSQVIMSLLIIASQVLLCLLMYIMFEPTAIKSQPVITEKFVELACDMTLPGLASFLAYNIVLVSLCSVFAFKTRKLPDNFNESRFISMCVYTTLVIWLAFIPTYFTASRESVRLLLLSVALLLNHTVALVFLFLPKIYAVMYVPSENVVTNRMPTGGTGISHNATGSSNRVAPANEPPRLGFKKEMAG